MFGLGFWELAVILLIALLVLGPKKLPDLASTLGKAIRSFRKATSDLQSQLDVDDEVKRPFQELKAALRNEPEPIRPVAAPAEKKTELNAAKPPDEAKPPESEAAKAEPKAADKA